MEIYKELNTGFARAVRPIPFHTKIGEDTYFSSHDGTLVLIRSGTRLYGVTYQHVLGGHKSQDLLVHFDLNGDVAYKPASVVTVGDGGVHFSDTDVEDILLAQWDNTEQIVAALGDAVALDGYRAPDEGDVLGVAGFLKSRSDYAIQPAKTFCFQTVLIDQELGTHDPLLRKAAIELDTEESEDAFGLSGA